MDLCGSLGTRLLPCEGTADHHDREGRNAALLPGCGESTGKEELPPGVGIQGIEGGPLAVLFRGFLTAVGPVLSPIGHDLMSADQHPVSTSTFLVLDEGMVGDGERLTDQEEQQQHEGCGSSSGRYVQVCTTQVVHTNRVRANPPCVKEERGSAPPRGRGRAWQGALMLAAPPRGIYLRHPSLASIWGTHLGSARSELPKSNPWAPCPGIEPPGAQGDLAPWTAPGPQRQRGLRPWSLRTRKSLRRRVP